MSVHAPRSATITHGHGVRYVVRAVGELALVTVIVVLGLALGWWWVTFVAGLAAGVAVRRARRAVFVGAGAGLLGWGLPLATEALSSPVGRASTVISALMGYANGAVAPVVTLLVGLVLGACGVWLGRAVRAYLPRSHSSGPIDLDSPHHRTRD